MSQENVDLVLRGYRAFLDGDFATLAELLDPEVEWAAVDRGASDCADRDEVLRVLAERLHGDFRVELERAVGVGERVVVSFRATGVRPDPTDDRPLQTRRYFTIGRYAGVVTIRDGRVVHVQDYPHPAAALEAVGLQGEFA